MFIVKKKLRKFIILSILLLYNVFKPPYAYKCFNNTWCTTVEINKQTSLNRGFQYFNELIKLSLIITRVHA